MRSIRPYFQQTCLVFGQYRRFVYFCRFTICTSPFLRCRRFGKCSDTFYIPQQLSNDYGVTLTESPLRGLTARAVVVLNEQNQVLHAELVSEIANEPDYEAALAVL